MIKKLTEFKKKYEMNLNEKGPIWAKIYPKTGECYWNENDYKAAIEYDTDWPEDPATLVAEKEEQIEIIENLFAIRQTFKQEIIEIEKSLPFLEDYNFELLQLDARDYCYMIENIERQLEFIL
jgi:hypothetical protein